MTEVQLKFCKICKNQKLDMTQGIVCKLTNRPADFEETCEYYIEDANLQLDQELAILEKEIQPNTASRSKRFANYLIDLFFYLIFSSVFGLAIGTLIVIVSPSSLYILEQDNVLFDYAFGFVTGIIYYTALEAATGRTIAKYFTKTKVVNKNGEKPDFGSILLRSLCRYIPFEAFTFLAGDDSGLHDKLSKTRVIEA